MLNARPRVTLNVVENILSYHHSIPGPRDDRIHCGQKVLHEQPPGRNASILHSSTLPFQAPTPPIFSYDVSSFTAKD